MENLYFNYKRGAFPAKKFLLIMRLSCLLLLVMLLQVTATGYSQTEAVSIRSNNITLEQLFAEIEKQANVKFLYRYENIADKSVQVNVENVSISTLLNNVLQTNDLQYTLMDNNLIVVAPELKQQGINITGNVTDANGEPIPGVNVTIKGTTVGNVTDINGRYSIYVPDASAVLMFSFIGYLSQEIEVGNQRNILITLLESTMELDEVVVVGYGSVRKKDLTGSVSAVAMSEMDKQPVFRVEEALRGKAAGVQITKQNTAPGAGIKIRIRGANSVNGNNEPLYVIDGFLGGDFASLNPNDIESINILKDASATAIYGSRGSNGVILVTTKQAKEGESRIEYNGFLSFDKISKKMDLLSASEYMKVVNDRESELGNNNAIFSQKEIDDMKASGGTDWVDEIMRTGVTQNHQLSISGGTPKVRYYLSGTYLDQNGIVENSWYKRYGLRSNINSTVGKKIDVAFNLYGTYTHSRNNGVYNGRNTPMGHALLFPPNLPIIDPATNDYIISPQGSYGPIAGNPVFSTLGAENDNTAINALSNLNVTWRIVDGLKFSVAGGINLGSYLSPLFGRNAPGPGSSPAQAQASHYTGQSYTYQNTNILSYEKLFADIHRLDVSAVYEQQKYVSKSTVARANGFPTTALKDNALSLGSVQTVGSEYDEWSIQSFLGRINYTLKERYLFTMAFRADGSSKFAKGNKYAYFPSGAIAWRASEEEFIKNMNFFQNLKIRASYGEVGSQAVPSYKTLAKMKLDMEYFFNKERSTGIGTDVPSNPDLKWETTAQTNFGIDFGILDGRLSGTVDYYYKKTRDLLFDVQIPGYMGQGSITKNIGSLENKGWEFLLSGVIVDRKDFQLISSINLSMNRGKILDMGDQKEILVNWDNQGSPHNGYSALRVGEPMGIYRGYVFDGVWKSNEAAEAQQFNRSPGDYKYRNITKAEPGSAEQLDDKDMTIIGNSNPKFTWGWNTTAVYKNWDLSVYIYGIQGNDVWNFTRHLITGYSTDVKIPTSREILNRWSPSNENVNIAKFSNTTGTQRQSDQWVEDGSFIRMGNITLGYTFNNLIKNSFIRDAKVYISSSNLFIITKYKGFDPESSMTPTTGDTMSDKVQGFDDACYPPTRSFVLGVKFSF